jgi:hypothetical protein
VKLRAAGSKSRNKKQRKEQAFFVLISSRVALTLYGRDFQQPAEHRRNMTSKFQP